MMLPASTQTSSAGEFSVYADKSILWGRSFPIYVNFQAVYAQKPNPGL
jgi:hypothetical protein